MRAEELLTLARSAGYKNPRIEVHPHGGAELVVEENLRDESDWPLLWQVCHEAGVAHGGGGTYFQQVKLEDVL